MTPLRDQVLELCDRCDADPLRDGSVSTSELRELCARDPWLPIGEAPKDGTFMNPPKRILLLFADGTVECGRWELDRHARKPRPYFSGDRERIFGINHYRQKQPIGWIPLPALPQGGG